MINCLTDCPDIGYCCRVFTVWGGSVHAGMTNDDLTRLFLERGAPFAVVAKVDRRLFCRCVGIGDDGLCLDYQKRPETCRDFLPGSDPLCCLFVGPAPLMDLPTDELGDAIHDLRWSPSKL